MTLSEWAYNMAHIPGSLNITSTAQAEGLISPSDEIVVYCSDVNCMASRAAYQFLVNNGYENVRRYAGGIADWQQAGYPLARGNEE